MEIQLYIEIIYLHPWICVFAPIGHQFEVKLTVTIYNPTNFISDRFQITGKFQQLVSYYHYHRLDCSGLTHT